MHPALRLSLLLAVVIVPGAAHAETYIRTIPASYQNYYALDYRTNSAEQNCFALYFNYYKEKDACNVNLAQIRQKPENIIMDACNQITKTTYTYTLPKAACFGSIRDYQLQTAAAPGSSGSSVSTQTFTRTLDKSDVGKFSLEGAGWRKQSDSSECYDIGGVIYASEAICKANVDAYQKTLTTNPALRDGRIIANCTKITKTDYEYKLPAPVCASSLSKMGLIAKETSSGNSGPGKETSSGNSAGKGTGTAGDGGGVLKNPLKFNSLPELLAAILQAVVQLGAILLTLMLVWVGFLFVTAQGNPEKVSTAKTALLWTVIGGLILLAAEAISKVIEATATSLLS